MASESSSPHQTSDTAAVISKQSNDSIGSDALNSSTIGSIHFSAIRQEKAQLAQNEKNTGKCTEHNDPLFGTESRPDVLPRENVTKFLTSSAIFYGSTGFPDEEHGDDNDGTSVCDDALNVSNVCRRGHGHRPKKSSFHTATTRGGTRSRSMQYREKADSGEIETYPPDCYSFMALHSPIESPGYFFFGFMVFCFQIMFLIYMVLSQVAREFTSSGEIDNPSDGFFAVFIPANVSALVRFTQVTAVMSYCVFADSSLKDCTLAVEQFPRFDRAEPGDKLWLVALSCSLRFIQGFLAIFATLLLIITSDDVVEIILNFAAVNYISTLDEVGFELAKWGKYGPTLERKAVEIEQKPIPYCAYRKYAHIRYLMTVIPIMMTLLVLTGMVIYGQENSNFWVTDTMRVQFQESTGLQAYSGCYELSPGVTHSKRRNYKGFGANLSPGVIGYCREKRHWILFKNEGNGLDEGGMSNDPCKVTRENELAYSATTDSFDVSSSFDESWFSASGTPLDLYFFESIGTGENLLENCGAFLNNGQCDVFFNTLGYQYDGGDCCASTCSQPNCGSAEITNGFGIEENVGDGYPHCLNPAMVPMTIRLNAITSSRDRSVLNVTDAQEEEYYSEKGIYFWDEQPNTPYFILDCNDYNVLSIYINKTMEGMSETVMVEDGARCKVSISNTTDFSAKWDSDPIWWVNYTIYHGNDTVNEMLNGYSGIQESYDFYRIPECYFDRLENSTDLLTSYSGETTLTESLYWLANDESGFSSCNGVFLFERFALASINFAAPIVTDSTNLEDTLWINTQQQCRWQNIACNKGSVETLAVRSKNLEGGTIPTTVGLLTGLRILNYDENRLVGTIPSEIGLLTNLEGLEIDKNELTGTLPTEIGNLAKMVELDIDGNRLSGSIPTEFGKLTRARDFDFLYNNLSGAIPTEIGHLKQMARLGFVGNQFTGTIPTEVGLMGNLEGLQLAENKITGSVPIEIESIGRTLTFLWLSRNELSGSIPPQIGQLTELKRLELDGNMFTGSIPTQIGLVKSLRVMNLRGNQFTGTIPSEIGLLTNLVEIHLEENSFVGTIPIEVTQLKSLRILTFDRDKLDEEGSFIPNNIETLKECILCEGADYALRESNGQTVSHEDEEFDSINSYTCPELLEKMRDPDELISADGCATLEKICVSCGS